MIYIVAILMLFTGFLNASAQYTSWAHKESFTTFDYCWNYDNSATIEDLEMRAKKGEVKAMYDLGERLISNSRCDDKQIRKGLQWIKLSADNKCPKAMYYLICYTGSEINRDYRMTLANEICDHPNHVYEPDVLYATAQIYRNGIPYVSPSEYWFLDNNRYVNCLKMAADLGLPIAQYELSQLLCWGGLPRINKSDWYIRSYTIDIDINKSYEYFKKAGGSDEEYNDWAYKAADGGVVDASEKVFENVEKSLDMFEILYINGYIPAGISLAIISYGIDNNRAFKALTSLVENHADFIEAEAHFGLHQRCLLGKYHSDYNDESPPSKLYRYLSACYRFGRGCEIDIDKADYYLKKSKQFKVL